jgi:hypothetical protein
MPSSANVSALQIAQKHNVTGGRADEESQSRSLYLLLEIKGDGVLMHPGCKSTHFSCLAVCFRFSSLAPVREQRGRDFFFSTVDSRKSALSPAKYSETSSTGVSSPIGLSPCPEEAVSFKVCRASDRPVNKLLFSGPAFQPDQRSARGANRCSC